MDPMVAKLVEAFVPIVAIVMVFGAPVALYLGHKFFKLKEKELTLEGEARKWAENSQAMIEARVQRLESVLLSLDSSRAQTHLMEAPATQGTGQPGPVLDPQRTK